MKNQSFGKVYSLFQINQVCNDENQGRNLTSINFGWLCEIFAYHAKCKRSTSCRTKSKAQENVFHNLAKSHKPGELRKSEFRNLCEISQALRTEQN